MVPNTALAGITQHPTEEWMVQMARNAVDDVDSALLRMRFAVHDRRHKVLQLIPNHAQIRRSSADSTAAAQSEFECLRGAMGALHQR